MKLPEMPELPFGDVSCSYSREDGWHMFFLANKPSEFHGPDELFTADQLRAYGKLCLELGYKMGREDAAKIAEQKRDEWLLVKWPDNLEDFGKRMVASIASAIRQQGEPG